MYPASDSCLFVRPVARPAASSGGQPVCGGRCHWPAWRARTVRYVYWGVLIGPGTGCAPPIAPAGESESSGSDSADGSALRGSADRPCFHPELGDFDISCLTEAELAAVLADSDRDGKNNL